MTPWFVLSYPRSRTAWLAMYLTHNGVYAFHEAWKYVKTVQQLRSLMESKGDGPVVNVDCANWFFLKELQDEFPEARFLEIRRPWDGVVQSALCSFGDQDYDWLFRQYLLAMKQPVRSEMVIEFAQWTPDQSQALWLEISQGRVMDEHWHRHLHNCLVELMPEAVREELDMGQRGELLHITQRMQAV